MTTTPDPQPVAEPAQDPSALVASAPTGPDNAPEAVNAPAPDEGIDLSLAGEAMNLISGHKGKLAIGVAATLGLMVYYGWREKRLAKSDPEEYARLQRLKASVRHSDAPPRTRAAKRSALPAEPDAQPAPPPPADIPPAGDSAKDIS